MAIQSIRLFLGTLALTVLTACGGSSSEIDTPHAADSPGPSTTSVPADVYVGYYQEISAYTASLPSSTYLHIPLDNPAVAGQLAVSSTCTGSSLKADITGLKSGTSLKGTWLSTQDNTVQGGSYTGTLQPVTKGYAGTYTNETTASLPSVDGSSCASTAPVSVGNWEIFPMTYKQPANFTVQLQADAPNAVSWPVLPQVAYWLVSVYDIASPRAALTAQQVVVAKQNSSQQHYSLASLPNALGGVYVVAITAFNAENARIGFATLAVPASTR